MGKQFSIPKINSKTTWILLIVVLIVVAMYTTRERGFNIGGFFKGLGQQIKSSVESIPAKVTNAVNVIKDKVTIDNIKKEVTIDNIKKAGETIKNDLTKENIEKGAKFVANKALDKYTLGGVNVDQIAAVSRGDFKSAAADYAHEHSAEGKAESLEDKAKIAQQLSQGNVRGAAATATK
jgi:hypothetical protein